LTKRRAARRCCRGATRVTVAGRAHGVEQRLAFDRARDRLVRAVPVDALRRVPRVVEWVRIGARHARRVMPLRAVTAERRASGWNAASTGSRFHRGWPWSYRADNDAEAPIDAFV